MDITEKVKQMNPVERFLYWIEERHNIYLKRTAGEPKPWTNDPVLRDYFFTNPLRENDKTTIWFRENIREELRDDPAVFFATVSFRWFNWIPVGELGNRYGFWKKWDSEKALPIFQAFAKEHGKFFTGAFLIPAARGTNKIEHVCGVLDGIWSQRRRLVKRILEAGTLQGSHSILTEIPWLGKFMAYEVVTDLRHTYLLENAPDIMTWANPGPGCVRGLYRILEIPLPSFENNLAMTAPKNWQEKMQELLQIMQERLPHIADWEMRDVEHSLCEVDKYSRILFNQGRSKRTFNGKAD